MDEFLNALIRGIQTGAIYGLIGLGLNVIFAATGVFNFAQGEMVMVGALLGVGLWVGNSWPLVLALIAVMAVCGGIGGLTEIVAVRGTARFKQATLWMLSTLGVAIIVRSTASILTIGNNTGDTGTRSFPYYINTAAHTFGNITIIPQRAVLVPITIVVTLLVWLWFQKTNWGRGLKAVAFDREGAAMRGLPVARLALIAFILGGALAALGGFLAGPITQASIEMGFGLTIRAFIAAAIGGIPELWGPLLGGIILGLGEQFTATYLDSSLQDVIALGLLLVVLLLRPSGLIGRQVRTL